MKSKIILPILLLALLYLSSCATKVEEKNSAELLYNKAHQLMQDKNFSEAATAFEKIDDDFPFSKWSLKAQTMAVYCHYKEENNDKILQITDDFIRLNPASEYMPYMLYMKGLSYYDQIPDIKRAQDNTKQADYTFRELIARFPSSEYAFDAKEKLQFINEHLAGAKMAIGRYQMKNENYIGAIQHFSEVINRYHYTKQSLEAYYRLAEIYFRLGLKDEAKKAIYHLQNTALDPENEWLIAANKFFGEAPKTLKINP